MAGPRSGVVVLSSSRQAFASALEEFNDGWLLENAMTGDYAPLLSKINILYEEKRLRKSASVAY